MSLSANERKVFWQNHKDSLNRIRYQLDDQEPPLISPGGSGRKHNHSPLGLYRKPSPSLLPRIDSPDNDGYRPKIRGSRYDIVPPLNNRTPEYDSWGEESDEEWEDGLEHVMPLPYPYPILGYPAYHTSGGYHPPPIMYGNPFPVYYPPPPAYKERRKRKDGGEKNVEMLEVHQSYPAGRKSKRVTAVQLPVMHRKTKGLEEIEPKSKKDLTKKYKYIYPRDSPYVPNLNESYVNTRYRNEQAFDTKSYAPTIIGDDIVDDVVKSMTREAVRGGLSEMVNEYLGNSTNFAESGDPLTRFLDKLFEEAIQDSTEEVVRDTVRELASDHMSVNSTAAVVDDLLLDHLQDIEGEMVDDVILEVILEEFINTYVIEPEMEEEISEIAKEVLEHYDTKIEKKELREISKKAGNRLLESICLEYLLSLISRQGKVWNESDHANKFLDDVILNILVSQYTNVIINREKTISNQSLKKLHEKVVSDVALDLLLQQLSSSLDEDLADVDEYERGIDEYNSTS